MFTKILFVFAFALFIFPVLGLKAEVITMRADLWCPYTCDPKSDRPGFMVELAREIFKESGHTVDYQVMNWARAVADTRGGIYYAVIGANRGDVPGFILPEMSQGENVNYFWALKDSAFSYQNIDSIKGKKIGVINGYSYGGEELDTPIRNRHQSFVVLPGDDALTKMIKMTEAKRIDAFVENPYVLQSLLKTDLKKYENKFKQVSKNVVIDPQLFIAFSPAKPQSEAYAKILSEGMKKIRKSGKLKEILERYEIADWIKEK